MSIEIITSLLEAKRAQAEAKRREADILDAEARGLQAALDALRQTLTAAAAIIGPHVPARARTMFIAGRSAGGQSAVGRPKANAGRQPGSLSNRWKRHLLELYNSDADVFSKDDVARVVFDREQRVMKPSEIQRLFENFSRYGHVTIIDDGLYVIPEEAALKFKATLREELDTTDEPEDHDDDEQLGSKETEEEGRFLQN